MGKPPRSELILLVDALLSGDIKAVRAQLQGATSVNVRLPQRKNRPARETPLMLAAEQGYLPVVRLLISLGTNINDTNEFRQRTKGKVAAIGFWNCSLVANDFEQLRLLNRLDAAKRPQSVSSTSFEARVRSSSSVRARPVGINFGW